MTVPVGYRARKGDIVAVKAVVKYDQEDDELGKHIWINRSEHVAMGDVLDVIAIFFPVGAKVRYSDPETFRGDEVGTIVATHGPWVWVDFGSGPDTAPSSEFELVPEKTEDAPDDKSD
jgi:hypothetical protein